MYLNYSRVKNAFCVLRNVFVVFEQFLCKLFAFGVFGLFTCKTVRVQVCEFELFVCKTLCILDILNICVLGNAFGVFELFVCKPFCFLEGICTIRV